MVLIIRAELRHVRHAIKNHPWQSVFIAGLQSDLRVTKAAVRFKITKNGVTQVQFELETQNDSQVYQAHNLV